MSIPRRLWRLARHAARSIPPPSIPRTHEDTARRDAERELEEFLGSAPSQHAAAPPPPPPPPHPFERQYAILGVPAGADAETVERAWRRLVLRNHPDRFAGDPAAERAASDRLREINQAHDELMAWLQRERRG